MRFIVKRIFLDLKGRVGEYLFNRSDKSRIVGMWLQTIMWNVPHLLTVKK